MSKKTKKQVKAESKTKEVQERKLTSEDMKKYTKIAAYIIVGLIVVYAAIFIKQNFLSGKFSYNDIEFAKTVQGKINFYTATIPVFSSSGSKISEIYIDFRNDPRKLNDVYVPSNLTITLNPKKMTFVTINEPITPCPDNGLAMINLGRALSNLGYPIKGAVNNKSYAGTNTTYANCNLYPSNSVIMITNGDKNEIKMITDNCYEIVSTACDVLKVTEKFELKMLERYQFK